MRKDSGHIGTSKMGIEEDIQQKRFENEWQKLNINLIYTTNWVRDKTKDFFEPFGITSQQFNVLRILRGNHPEPYTTSKIRERMLDKMSDVSRIVDRLCAKGLTARSVCDSDRRLVDVVITDEGLELLKSMDEVSSFAADLLSNLDQEDAEKLNDLLDKIRE